MKNGLSLDGKIYILVVNSYGEGSQSITWQASVLPPGGSLTRLISGSGATTRYNYPPAEYQDCSSPYANWGEHWMLPPDRMLDINQYYPAGTIFIVEASLDYWIKSCGKESWGSVTYNLEANPYINLAACSWQWP